MGGAVMLDLPVVMNAHRLRNFRSSGRWTADAVNCSAWSAAVSGTVPGSDGMGGAVVLDLPVVMNAHQIEEFPAQRPLDR
jgi:hypothetical protein